MSMETIKKVGEYASLIAFTIGVFLKMLHISNSDMLIFVGGILCAIFFVPRLVKRFYKVKEV